MTTTSGESKLLTPSACAGASATTKNPEICMRFVLHLHRPCTGKAAWKFTIELPNTPEVYCCASCAKCFEGELRIFNRQFKMEAV
jgi:hypothetical protein